MNARIVTALALLALAGCRGCGKEAGKETGQQQTGAGEGGTAARSKAPCSVTVSGTVNGSFRCFSEIRRKDRGLQLLFAPDELPSEIGAFLGGPVVIAGPLSAKKTYTIERATSGKMMLLGPKRESYIVEAGKSPRGNLTLDLKSFSAEAHSAIASGTLTAQLVPLDAKQGRDGVTVMVQF